LVVDGEVLTFAQVVKTSFGNDNDRDWKKTWLSAHPSQSLLPQGQLPARPRLKRLVMKKEEKTKQTKQRKSCFVTWST